MHISVDQSPFVGDSVAVVTMALTVTAEDSLFELVSYLSLLPGGPLYHSLYIYVHVHCSDHPSPECCLSRKFSRISGKKKRFW
jgi:hypothetical protein